MSYENAVYEMFREVNNRLRELGEAQKPGEYGCQDLGGASLKLVEGQDAPAFSSAVRPANEILGVISPSIWDDAASVNHQNVLAPGLTQRTVMHISAI